MKLGAHLWIVAGEHAGASGRFLRERDGAVYLRMARGIVAVPRAHVSEHTPRAVIEASVREAVWKRGYDFRLNAWWMERVIEGSEDPVALSAAEQAFRAELDREADDALRATLGAEFEAQSDAARAAAWEEKRAEWTQYREENARVCNETFVRLEPLLLALDPPREFGDVWRDAMALKREVDIHARRRLLESGASMRENPALEAMIEANPKDDAPRLVFADWLEEQGDSRGALATEQASGRLVACAPFLGPLARWEETLRPQWRVGFLDAVRVAVDDDWDLDISQLLRAVLALPTARAPLAHGGAEQ